MIGDPVEAAVRDAANRLLADFARNDVDAYFSAFRPDATFLFHNVPELMASRDAYRAEFARWLRDGFRVIAYESEGQWIHVLGDVAIFTHRSLTRSSSRTGVEEARERETIVFAREADGRWLGVHEHLSLGG